MILKNGDPSTGYPHGYWYASTEDGNFDADGATPLDAAAALVDVLENALTEARGL